MRFLIGSVAALIVAAPAAAASILDQTAAALRGHAVYVHPGSKRLTRTEIRRLERQIEDEARGPVVVVILPRAARREADGTTTGVLIWLSHQVFTTNPPATYAVVIGNEFRASNRDIPAGELAAQALRAHRGEGLAAVLSDFVRRVGAARAAAAAPVQPDDDGGSSNLWILVAIGAAAAAVAFGAFRRVRR